MYNGVVIMFSKNGCSRCVEVKDLLKDVRIIEVDVTQPEAAKVMRLFTPIRSLPQIFTNSAIVPDGWLAIQEMHEAGQLEKFLALNLADAPKIDVQDHESALTLLRDEKFDDF